MIRVLQLLSRPTEFQSAWGATLLAEQRADEFDVWRHFIGRGGAHRGFLSAILSLFGNVSREFDVVHAWDPATLRIAHLSGARRIVFSPSAMVGRSVADQIRKMRVSRDVGVICSSADEQRAYVNSGIDEFQTYLARPGIGAGRVAGTRDAALRAELGFSDDDYVLLAPGETTRAAGHREAAWTVGILSVLDRRYKLLTWGRGPLAHSLNTLAKKIGPPGMVTAAEQKLGRAIDFADLPGACDAAIFAPAGPTPPLPIAICLAAGLPIIASPLPGLEELVDHQKELIAPSLAPRILAQRVLELRKAPALIEAIARKAKEKAKRLFDPSRFCEVYREAYRDIAGKKSGGKWG